MTFYAVEDIRHLVRWFDIIVHLRKRSKFVYIIELEYVVPETNVREQTAQTLYAGECFYHLRMNFHFIDMPIPLPRKYLLNMIIVNVGLLHCNGKYNSHSRAVM